MDTPNEAVNVNTFPEVDKVPDGKKIMFVDSEDNSGGTIQFEKLRNQIASDATDPIARAQIQNLAKLPEGSTTGDAELSDIRVGADGTQYPNAGAAVREQIKSARKNADEAIASLKEDKIDKPLTTDDGKIPRAKSGGVEWVEVGQPTDEQTNGAVANWLNEHPEVTTTVQDGSITEQKMLSSFLPYIKKDYVTPQMFGAIADGNSHKLNTKYSSLEKAKEKYPFIDNLDIEIDTCALQSCLNYIYNRNTSGRIFVPNGRYLIDRELYCSAITPYIEGETVGDPEGGKRGANFIWNGDSGTEEEPKFIIKFESQLPDGSYPSDARPDSKKRIRQLDIKNISFKANSSINNKKTDYVSAIYIGSSGLFDIKKCNFGNVYDGIVCNTVLLSNISSCNFYGPFRDCIRIMRTKVEYSTTYRIFRNEFGFFGRYAILANSSGGSGSTPEIFGNDYEGSYEKSIYYTTPSNFVQGIKACVCLIAGGGGYFKENRFEDNRYDYSLHLVNCNGMRIDNNAFDYKGIIMSATKTSLTEEVVTQEYINYYAAHNYDDITASKNLLLINGSNSELFSFTFYSNNYYGKTFLTEIGECLNTATNPSFLVMSSGRFSRQNIPVIDGALDYDNAQNELSANAIRDFRYRDSTEFIGYGIKLGKRNANIENTNRFLTKIKEIVLNYCKFNIDKAENDYDGWTVNGLASHPLTSYETNFIDTPLIYANVTDGTKNRYYEVDVIKKRKIRYEFFSKPVSGTWNRGDICYAKNPITGGYIGWVCIEAGTPGTWKGFGKIED